jgi:phosphatidylserine decarboxylase
MAIVIKPREGVCPAPRHVGGWLPDNPKAVFKYIEKVVDKVKHDPPPRSQAVRDLENLINTDPEAYMLFNEMLDEIPLPYRNQGPWPVKDVPTLLSSLDLILTTAPYWTSASDAQIGTPINALLLWPMATTAGFAVFLKSNVNEVLKNILNHWGDFLSSSDSCSTLNDQEGGWLSTNALQSPHLMNFAANYVCDPALPHWGFTSWDDFFTRQFRDGVRQVAGVGDDSIIASAAESTPFSVQTGVQLFDKYWIKGQPYSLTHMMDHDPRATNFVGGTVSRRFSVLIATIVGMPQYLARSSTPSPSLVHTTPSPFCTASSPMKAVNPWILAPTNCRKVTYHPLLPAALSGSRQTIQTLD